jgi:predicted metal-dependent peptidase
MSTPASPELDPFAAIEQVAIRQEAEEKAGLAVTTARARLVLGRDARSVFFATLALRLRTEVNWSIDTMAVDGKTMFYNPEFVNGLTPEELLGVVVHETMHVALAHHCRRQNRDPKRWNEACDLSENQVILKAGFVLPKCRLMPGEGSYKKLPLDKSSEEYYGMLPPDPPGGGGQQGSDPGGCGEVLDVPSPAEASDQEDQWKAAVVQAENAAKGRGQLPAGLARTIDKVVRPPADWKAVLREFVSRCSKSDFSWTRPNRRFIAQGLYLPGMHSECLGEVLVLVDTSGSIGPRQLSAFANELDGILGSFECQVTVVYHDTDPHKVTEHSSTDGPFTLEPVGGGGTSHEWLNEWLDKHGSSPACCVALTDLDTAFGPDPGIPVLWAVTGGSKNAPFGRVVNID